MYSVSIIIIKLKSFVYHSKCFKLFCYCLNISSRQYLKQNALTTILLYRDILILVYFKNI